MTAKLIYDFDEYCEGGREVLGGKGLGLAEMTALDLPVPLGFTVTTEACRHHLAHPGPLPVELCAEIEQHLALLEERAGQRFGDPAEPLLVSVRSGGPVSMPGMMETILNLGMNDAVIRQAHPAAVHFLLDDYRRLIQMYGEVVAGIDSALFAKELEAFEALDEQAHGHDDLYELVDTFRGIYLLATGTDFPQDPRQQLFAAVAAVFDSWNVPRARVYRATAGISEDAGTAANVVQMVFGNRDSRSATGVCFSRDPATGQPGLYGEFLSEAQGEDIVAGTRTPQPVAEMRAVLPRPMPSSRRRSPRSNGTTATCRTSSSPSRAGASTCCRHAAPSAPQPPRCALRSTWRAKAS